MSHLPEPVADGEVPAPAAMPRAHREPEGAWIAGVASGVAQHLGWPVLLVRGAFLLLAGPHLVGVFVYGLLWVLMPRAERAAEAPGLESAERRGLRRPGRLPARRRDNAGAVAVALIGGGGALLALRFGGGPSSAIFWPLALACAGVALVWRQADAPRAGRRAAGTRRLPREAWPTVLSTVLGLGLVGVSVSLVALSRIRFSELPMMLGLSALMVAGFAIAGAPWVASLRRGQQQAHERAVLEQARADMAAHLHDSVLQTLALIQRRADDPKAVAQLARGQERELRAWLYGEQVTDASLKAALTRAAAEIEDERGIEVELVCVGDVELDPRLEALVRAAREAMMNAAKHSGMERIDVYCEVDGPRVEVFVRDRGRGFDLEGIADDRMGVRRSIVERMERHGGTARIRSAVGEGTEVALVMEG